MAESNGGSNSDNKRNTTMKQIASALVKAQREFSPALKTSSNPHFRSKYAALDACIDAVIDALNNNGIMLTQRTYESDSGVTVETVFVHESGEIMECGKLHVPASKQDPQGYGSALTYCRRYSLMAACGLAPEDDDGNSASKPKQQTLTESAVCDFLASINAAESMESLQKSYTTAFRAADHIGDTKAKDAFVNAKDQRKAALQNEIAAQE